MKYERTSEKIIPVLQNSRFGIELRRTVADGKMNKTDVCKPKSIMIKKGNKNGDFKKFLMTYYHKKHQSTTGNVKKALENINSAKTPLKKQRTTNETIQKLVGSPKSSIFMPNFCSTPMKNMVSYASYFGL